MERVGQELKAQVGQKPKVQIVAQLLTHVDEAIVNVAPPRDPFEWFRSLPHYDDLTRYRGEHRWLLFLGFDAGRRENSTEGMLDWFDDFGKMVKKSTDPSRFAATLFVLDWDRDDRKHRAALSVEDSARLIEAGLCYRVKNPHFYGRVAPGQFGQALRRDMLDKKLILEAEERSIDEPVEPRPAPNENDPQFRETIDFLASSHFNWPPDAVRNLFGR